jgi:hypothetical protein
LKSNRATSKKSLVSGNKLGNILYSGKVSLPAHSSAYAVWLNQSLFQSSIYKQKQITGFGTCIAKPSVLNAAVNKCGLINAAG